MRRQEFALTDLETARSILQAAKIGHLAFLRDDGLELLPYNFALDGDQVYFHASPKTGLAQAVGQKIRFLAYDKVAWIPSTWRHPELACPATTYFCSLTLNSSLAEVTEIQEKARALECFMKKYQPDEPYKALDDPAYHGPLDALFVGKIKIENPVTKMKMGQHLKPKHRENVYRNLRKRSLLGDREVAQAMRNADPDLGDKPWVESLTEAQLHSVTELLRDTYWAINRSVEEQRLLNHHSQVLVAHCQGEQVTAFARVSLASPGTGYLADVVVHPEHRGKGLGKELVERITQHPRIKRIGRLMMVTKDSESLYRQFGFEAKYRTDTTFMVRESKVAIRT
jgi:uncharacterized protein